VDWTYGTSIFRLRESGKIKVAGRPLGFGLLEFNLASVYEIGGTIVARYYLAQTTEDQVVFAVNPQIGGPEHHECRWLGNPELEKLSPPRLLPVIRWARGVVGG
jgi:hypothetical protein